LVTELVTESVTCANAITRPSTLPATATYVSLRELAGACSLGQLVAASLTSNGFGSSRTGKERLRLDIYPGLFGHQGKSDFQGRDRVGSCARAKAAPARLAAWSIGRAPPLGNRNRTDRGLDTAPDTRLPSYL